MNISIIGSGYVGLVSGVCLSSKGHNVICVDNDQGKVDLINSGISPIHELGLSDLLKKNIGVKINATTNLLEAVLNSSVSIVAVGTPFDGDLIDLSYIKQVCKEIGGALKTKTDYHIVIVKSTVVPGTTDNVIIPLLEEYSEKISGKDFGVGMNPEFLREGVAVSDFMSPDRIILGAIDEGTHNVMKQLYDVFKEVDIVLTNNKTAEMIKYTSNSLLATLISFSNEIGNLCASLGSIDAVDVMKGVHLDKRVSPILDDGSRITPGIVSYMQSGCGFGGSCFPKDVSALISHGKNIKQPMDLLESVMKINRKQPNEMISRLLKNYPNINGMKISILGLSFKPGTADMRESPAIFIVKEIIRLGGKVHAYDPVAEVEARKIFGINNISYYDSVENAIQDAEVIMVLTSWPDILNLHKIMRILEINPLVVDGRRILSKDDFERYEGIGI